MSLFSTKDCITTKDYEPGFLAGSPSAILLWEIKTCKDSWELTEWWNNGLDDSLLFRANADGQILSNLFITGK